jgi:hypothetical protein
MNNLRPFVPGDRAIPYSSIAERYFMDGKVGAKASQNLVFGTVISVFEDGDRTMVRLSFDDLRLPFKVGTFRSDELIAAGPSLAPKGYTLWRGVGPMPMPGDVKCDVIWNDGRTHTGLARCFHWHANPQSENAIVWYRASPESVEADETEDEKICFICGGGPGSESDCSCDAPAFKPKTKDSDEPGLLAPSKPDNGWFIGADALQYLVAPAMREGGNWWETIEWSPAITGPDSTMVWHPINERSQLFVELGAGRAMRRNRSRVFLMGAKGKRYEFTSPMYLEPGMGRLFYYPSLSHGVLSETWTGAPQQLHMLGEGLVFDAIDEADACLSALFGLIRDGRITGA